MLNPDSDADTGEISTHNIVWDSKSHSLIAETRFR